MTYIILAAILVIVGVIGLLVAGASKSKEDRDAYADFPWKTTGVVVALLGFVGFGILTVAESATTVSPRAVGIQTAFGRYQSTLHSGLHWTAPWSGVEEFSTQVQYLEMNSAGTNVDVNYKGGGKGDVNVTVRWRINEDDARDLWKKYRQFEHVRDQLVKSSTRDSIRVVVGEYTPNDARAGENLRKITGATKDDLGVNLADDGVLIDSVSVTGINIDAETQASIQRVIQAGYDVQTAEQRYKQALIDQKTNAVRERGGLLTAQALQNRCLDILASWDQGKQGPVPATFQCLAAAGQTPVIVGGTK